MVEKQEDNSALGFTCRRPGEAGAFILEKTKKTDADSRQQSSAAIESLFADAIARVKTEAAQAIAEQRANSEAQAQQAIANIKAEHDEQISKLKAEVSERQKAATITESKNSAAGGVSKTIQKIAQSEINPGMKYSGFQGESLFGTIESNLTLVSPNARIGTSFSA